MKKYGRWGRCKADTTKPIKGTKRFHRCKNKADGPNGMCWEPTHQEQAGETYRQFQLDGIDTANVYERPLSVPLPPSQTEGGRRLIKEARDALTATQVPDPMKKRKFNLRLGIWVD